MTAMTVSSIQSRLMCTPFIYKSAAYSSLWYRWCTEKLLGAVPHCTRSKYVKTRILKPLTQIDLLLWNVSLRIQVGRSVKSFLDLPVICEADCKTEELLQRSIRRNKMGILIKKKQTIAYIELKILYSHHSLNLLLSDYFMNNYFFMLDKFYVWNWISFSYLCFKMVITKVWKIADAYQME